MKDSVVKDYERLVRQLDVALNGEAGAAKQAALVDIVGQVEAHVRAQGAPLLEAAQLCAQDALRHRATCVVMIKEHEDCIPDLPEERTIEAFNAWSDELIVNLQRYHPEDMP